MIRRDTTRRHARARRVGEERFSPLSVSADVLAFLVGIATQFSVHLVGDLPVAEVFVLLLVLPMLVMYRERVFRTDVRPIYILMGLWLMNQILTDIYRSTPQADWARGDAAIVFFAMDVAFVAALVGNHERRKILYVAGLSLGAIVSVRLNPSEMTLEYPWKFGYAMGVNLTVVLISCFFFNRGKHFVALGLMAGIAAVNLLFDFRSAVLILLLTIALAVPVIPEQIGPWRVLPALGSKMRLMVLASLAVLASLGASVLVTALASSGLLGDEAQEKNEAQAQVKGGLLLGGRPEILVSSNAVLDSPILGHGSWAKDFKYIEMLNDITYERGAAVHEDLDSLEEDSEGVIPAHSHLMGAWVWAGVMGGVIWVYLLWVLFRAVAKIAMYRPRFAPLYTYLLVTALWDILFSPFGSSRRIMEAVVIVIALDSLDEQGSLLSAVGLHRPRVWRRGAFRLAQPARSFSSAGAGSPAE